MCGACGHEHTREGLCPYADSEGPCPCRPAYEGPSGLDRFVAAESKKRTPRCMSCVLRAARPELWQEVLNGRARPAPYSYVVISQYLRNNGVGISHANLRDHFLAGHEETR